LIAFASLLDRLTFTTDTAARRVLLQQFCATQPDPDRGYAMAILAGTIKLPALRPSTLRPLAAQHCDPALFAWSHDFVGDLTETLALMWPSSRSNRPPPTIAEVVQTPRPALPAAIAGWLDACDAQTRLALLKLLTGGHRTSALGQEIRAALAEWGGRPLSEVEAAWHGLTPPYEPLFAWLVGHGPRPNAGAFFPFMLAGDAGPGEWVAEPFWQGTRLLVSNGRVFSRHADDVSDRYPDLRRNDVVLDGVMAGEPLHLRLFDILFDGSEDLRAMGFAARRKRLEAWFERTRPTGMAMSPLIPVTDDQTGLVLKRIDSPYVAGRDHGFWVARPHPVRTVTAALLYAEAGLYTVGLLRDGALIPVGQATAQDAAPLEAWIRDHTIARYGPVREVERSLIVSVTFRSVRLAPRRKAKIILEDARITGILSGAQPDDLDALGGGV
jgi:DNA ligase 1